MGGSVGSVHGEEEVALNTKSVLRSKAFGGIEKPEWTETNIQPPRIHTKELNGARTDIPIAFRWSNRCCLVGHGFVSRIAS
jgi:hypothetical protein